MARKNLIIGFILLLVAAGTIYYFDNYYSPVRISSDDHNYQSVPSIVAYQSHPPQLCTEDPLFKFRVEHQAEWHRIDNESEWYVYSAYIDRRPNTPVVKIIALARKGLTATLFCRWWQRRNDTATPPEPAQKKELWIRMWDSPEPERYYRPFLISCTLPRTGEPFAVSITTQPCGHVSHALQLDHYNASSIGDFAVCLKPLDFEEDISARLVEWLELQYLLGANTVHVYVRKVHPATRQTLLHYAGLGKLVAKVHFPPGMSDNTPLWQKRRHEMAVYNDCFYTHLNSYRYVVNLDLDEVIVPVKGDTWAEMLSDVVSQRAVASLSVRNVYYFDAFGTADEDVASIPAGMHMLRHVVRSSNFTPPGFAQKSFFSTDLVQAVTNHFALQATQSDVRLLMGLETNRGRLHHYRKDCPPLMERDCEENYMRFKERDTLLWKYKNRLIANFRKTMKKLGTN